jgi:aminopeptidase N
MAAFAVGAYTMVDLGTTSAGTHVAVYHFAGQDMAATTGTAYLKDAFDWYETNLGPYLYGDRAASIAVNWGPGAYGGMEHHPLWHVGSDSMSDPITHVHEAAHGWFGNGIRIRCWEDFVLSEGTVSYLQAHVTGAVRGQAAEDATWADMRAELMGAVAGGDGIAWPESCGQVDILRDGLFSSIPYMKGAFFYKAVEAQVGKPALVRALARFYRERKGQAAGMQDMLDTIRLETGFDPAALAQSWLRSRGIPQ